MCKSRYGLARIRPLSDKPRRAHLISVELHIIVIGMTVKFRLSCDYHANVEVLTDIFFRRSVGEGYGIASSDFLPLSGYVL